MASHGGNGFGSGGDAKLRARGVTVHYWLERARSPFLAVNGVDLDVRPGELVSLVATSTTRAGATANSEGVSSPIRALRDRTGRRRNARHASEAGLANAA